jgi:hypothetical protein
VAEEEAVVGLVAALEGLAERNVNNNPAKISSAKDS